MLPLTKFVKLIVPEVKSEGTCKQGERSDLTGCTPASGEASEKPPTSDNASDNKPKSKLPEKLAATVRSPQFKEWFGDWENDPANASKVADPETGEPTETHVIPRAVYHGRSRKFDAFKEGESPGVVGFFSESESYAGEYGESVEPFFLNIRKPVDFSKMGDATDRYSQTGKSVKRKVKEWFAIMREQGVDTSKINLGDEIDEDDRVPYWGLLDSSAGNVSKSSNLVAELRRQGFDGIIGREGEDNALAYAAFAPTQIKGADNEGTFDPKDPRTAKSLSVLPECPGCGGHIKSFGDLLVCEAPECTWAESSEVFVKSLVTEQTKGICQQGERSDLTGCTPANGETGENHSDSESANDVPDDLREIAQRPGMRSRINRMVSVAKGTLANALLTLGDLAPVVIPNAFDHARNALLSTAVPGVPVNDIALALSKVIAWTWKKAKANTGKSLSQNNAEQVREIVKVFYEMLDLPEDTPLPSDKQIAEVEKKREEQKQSKTMSAYDSTRGGALVGMPTTRRKLIHPRIKSLGYLSDAQMKAIGAGQTPGVPFQGPSGAWFVVRTSDGRVVRAKNPNAGGGSPAPANPTPTPIPAGRSNSPAAQARNRAIANAGTALSTAVGQLTSGNAISNSSVQFLAKNLKWLSVGQLQAAAQQLQSNTTPGLTKAQYISAIVAFASAPTPAPTPLPPVSTPAPAAATPAQNVNNAILKLTNSVALTQAELAQARQDVHQMSDSELDQALQAILSPSQQHLVPIANMSTATKQYILDQEILNQQNALPSPAPTVATPIAIPNKPGTSGRTPAPNISPKSKYPMRRSGPATSGKSDRDYRDDLVHAELQKMNVDPANATWSDKMQILSNLQAANLVDSSVDSSNIDIAVTSLISQLATTIIPPLSLYSHGNKRGNNPLAPDGMRPKLSTDQQVAVQNYTGTAYRDLNKSLRDHGTATPRTQKMHHDLQAAFAKTPVLSTPVPLKRAIMLDPAGLAAMLSSLQASEKAGTPVTFNNYHSCTTNPTTNPIWPDNVIFEIDAIHGLDCKPVSHNPQANEIILPFDAEFTVAGVTQDPYSGKWHVKLTQLPPAVAGKPPKVKPIKSKWSYLLNSGTTAPATTTPHTTPTDFPSDWTTSKAVQDAITGAKSHTFVTGQGSGHNDTALDDLLVESGRAEKPKIVDKASIDTLQQQGWTVFYRGVSSPQYTKQFRDGSLYNGSGYYGNGTYSQGTDYYVNLGAPSYGPPDPTGERRALSSVRGYGQHVLRYAMPPTAKIAKITDMQKEVAKAQAQLKKDYRAGKIKDATQYRKMNDLIADPGRMAALLNYDAIDAETSGYFVILNRSILQVEDKDQ